MPVVWVRVCVHMLLNGSPAVHTGLYIPFSDPSVTQAGNLVTNLLWLIHVYITTSRRANNINNSQAGYGAFCNLIKSGTRHPLRHLFSYTFLVLDSFSRVRKRAKSAFVSKTNSQAAMMVWMAKAYSHKPPQTNSHTRKATMATMNRALSPKNTKLIVAEPYCRD